MSPTLERRLVQLERQSLPSVPERVVWWKEGDPEPKGAPDKRLRMIVLPPEVDGRGPR
jgi:hypothetical protein